MATMTLNRPYTVVHPLDDVREVKRDASAIGPMPMTPVVKWCLFSLRAYLFLMMGLVCFHVADLGGVFRLFKL